MSGWRRRNVCDPHHQRPVVTPDGATTTTDSTITTTVTSSGSGDTVTGNNTFTSTETDSSTLTKSDSYADGSDSQDLSGSGTANTFSTWNDYSGTYSNTVTSTSSLTTDESGTRSGGDYSLDDTQTSSSTNTKTGNSLTGSYSLVSSSTDTEDSTRTGTVPSGQFYSETQSTTSTGSSTTSGNGLSGSFGTTSSGDTTVTTDQTTSGAGQGTSLHQLTTSDNSLPETGNAITGSFTSTDNPTITTTLDQSGYNAQGSFSLHETSSESPAVTTTGNSISGVQTITTSGDLTYGVTQTNASGSNTYTLSESGDKSYSRTENDDVKDGTVGILETGTDGYSLGENGSQGGTAYSQSVGGTDTYTTTVSQNAQTGTFSDATVGTGTYSTGGTAGSNSFSTSQSGNTFAGTVSLSQSGTSRYGLLQQFNNTSDGANGGAGITDFSPVGMPIVVQRSSVPAGTFSSIGDAAHLYCFARGTRVLLADGSYRGIEKIETGTMVLAAPEDDPEAAPTACRVLEVYHNPPGQIWEVRVADEVIRTTAGHPFYARGRGWTKACDLRVSDRLRTHEGRWAAVTGVRDTGRDEPVFNLCVESAHTYFVSTHNSRRAVLAHNASPAPGTTQPATTQPYDPGLDDTPPPESGPHWNMPWDETKNLGVYNALASAADKRIVAGIYANEAALRAKWHQDVLAGRLSDPGHDREYEQRAAEYWQSQASFWSGKVRDSGAGGNVSPQLMGMIWPSYIQGLKNVDPNKHILSQEERDALVENAKAVVSKSFPTLLKSGKAQTIIGFLENDYRWKFLSQAPEAKEIIIKWLQENGLGLPTGW